MKNKKKEIPNKETLTAFLEKKVFNEPILSLYQFQRGASSFNYLATLKNKKVLVKLAWKYKKEGVERLIKIISLLSAIEDLPIAKILTFNKKNIFKYENSYGFVLEYIDGASLPATKITKTHIQQIISAYKNIEKIKIQDKKLLMPAYNFKKIQAAYLSNCNKMMARAKKHPLFLYLLNKCKKNLIQIGNSPLTIKKNFQSVIHGDFHHNNMLFKNNKLVAILDLEDMGYGYKSEDLLRFILCLIARQPILHPKKKCLYHYLDYITHEFSYTQEEWLTGLNSFTLQKYKKMFSKEQKITFSNLKKMFHLLLFMRQYHMIEAYFKKAKKN